MNESCEFPVFIRLDIVVRTRFENCMETRRVVTGPWQAGEVNRIDYVPSLLVGFDTETTGLDTKNDEAISYGFSVYRNGVNVETSQFFAVPSRPMSPGAQRVHGVSLDQLKRMRLNGEALSAPKAAVAAATRLGDFASEGATFVGSNPLYDFTMLEFTLRRHGYDGLEAFGASPSLITLVDVVLHDLAIEPRGPRRPYRGLAQLCANYGVTPGGHDAAEDARAAVEVLLAQIAVNANTRLTAVDPGVGVIEADQTEVRDISSPTGHPI